MAATFNDYCDMNHIAKQVGGPKIYSSILVAGGMVIGVAAFELLPRFAEWATPKVESAACAVKSFMTGTNKGKETSNISTDVEAKPSIEVESDNGAVTQ